MQSVVEANKNNGTNLDVLLFFVRKYGKNLLIAALFGIVIYFVFHFLIEDVTLSALAIKRVDSMDATEAVYSESRQAEGENFINLNGTHVLKGGKRVNCDLLMILSDEKYGGDNYFAFSESLGEGECAVSNNLLASYGLKVGDTLSVSGTDVSYKIKLAMEPARGLDTAYMHEGAVVLGYNKDVLSVKDYSYITFMHRADGITNLKKIIFISRERESAAGKLALSVTLIALVSAFAVFLWEILIGRRSYSDFRRFAELGARPVSLYLKVLSEILFRYLLPEIAVLLIWHRTMGCYLESYVYPALAVVGINLVVLVLYSVFVFRRVSLCRLKKK